MTNTLSQTITYHLTKEKASFHLPGHKGRHCSFDFFRQDLTELPGFDDLSEPSGVLHHIENKASSLFNSRSSFLSVNGASACLIAALIAAFIAAASTGKTHILCPRNSHRSAINGLILSGLTPVWYAPNWNSTWGLWEEINVKSLEKAIKEQASNLAAVLITSPTYAGAISSYPEIAVICEAYNIPLIVDEAHGAHFLPELNGPQSALSYGAALVVHSLHKTLGAPTQTGLLHAGYNCPFSNLMLRDAMNLIQSSSPSYLLLSGIEDSIMNLDKAKYEAALTLAQELRTALENRKDIEVYTPSVFDPLHILIKTNNLSAEIFYEKLCEQGVYPEAVIGNGVLLLLGVGSTKQDKKILLKALGNITSNTIPCGTKNSLALDIREPAFGEQIMSPRQAFLASNETVPLKQAKGHIAASCVASCASVSPFLNPGVPVTVPGQIISYQLSEVDTLTKSVRVVNMSGGY